MEEIAPAHSGSHGSDGVFSRYPAIASEVDSNLYRTRQKGSEKLGCYRGNGGILCSCLQSIYGDADVFVSECLGTFVVFLCETVFLFSLPLYKSGQISSQLSRLIFTVTTLDSEDQRRRGFALHTEQKIALFAGLLERHQRYGKVGFKVAGLHITQLKSVWLTLLGPVVVFVGNVLLKEHF